MTKPVEDFTDGELQDLGRWVVEYWNSFGEHDSISGGDFIEELGWKLEKEIGEDTRYEVQIDQQYEDGHHKRVVIPVHAPNPEEAQTEAWEVFDNRHCDYYAGDSDAKPRSAKVKVSDEDGIILTKSI